MQIGDFVKGKPESNERYGITNEEMTKGVVVEVAGEKIKVRILEHEGDEIGVRVVESKYFEVIGHQKPFNRAEVLELLKNGCKENILDYDLTHANLGYADLSGANLRRADLSGVDLRCSNLSGADLDFSCWPLWCGSLGVKVDKRLACQLAYHLCSMECDDLEYLQMRNSILSFANQFHRVDECGELEEINPSPENS